MKSKLINPHLQKAKAHWKDKISAEPKIIHVDEWDLDIYVWPATMTERNRVYQSDGLAGAVEAVLVRAKNAEKVRLFQDHERQDLMNGVDPDLLIRIAADMLMYDQEQVYSIEEAKEDLETTQNSEPSAD